MPDEEEIEYIFEPESSRTELIMSAYYAISSVDGLNTMTAEESERKQNIISKSLRIIENLIDEVYDEMFFEEEI